jgi:hypothetical protein
VGGVDAGDQQRGYAHVPEKVLAGAHFVQRVEGERGQKPTKREITAIPYQKKN